MGNRLASKHNMTYEYNEVNQLVSTNRAAYTYDANGSRATRTDGTDTTAYTYDYENRLIKVEKPDGMVIAYAYDPFGRRIAKSVDGVSTWYFYDGEDVLFSYDASGGVINQYVHGPGFDEPLALANNKGVYYYHADGLGSIMAITDTTQTVVQDYEYDSFGNLKDQKNRVKQPYDTPPIPPSLLT